MPVASRAPDGPPSPSRRRGDESEGPPRYGLLPPLRGREEKPLPEDVYWAEAIRADLIPRSPAAGGSSCARRVAEKCVFCS